MKKKIYIKNMVCPRCITAVEQTLKDVNVEASSVQLGEVELVDDISESQLQELNTSLHKLGFEILDDQKQKLIEQIKNLLIQKVQSLDIEDHFSISQYLSKNIFKDYSYISKLFSEVEGITIEHFFILQKLEKVKELLAYDELSLNQISFKLGYSSPQHLSAQFKKMTGLTPGHFKKKAPHLRNALDKVNPKKHN